MSHQLPETERYAAVHYAEYLKIEQLLSAQQPRSAALGEEAHEEMLFIIVHQAYELWFKQIIHELESVMDMFRHDSVDEHSIGVAVSRLERIIEIEKLLIEQIRVLETMTPLDFLDFRSLLFPASGFQSFQFRKVEVLLGLESGQRITYNNKPYHLPFTPAQQEELLRLEADRSMLELIEDWLERTPFLEFHDFDFLASYRQAVEEMLASEQDAIRRSPVLNDAEKEMRLRMLGDTDTYFLTVLDPAQHEQMQQEGRIKLSYKATLAALLIHLYRDEPILHMPYKLLSRIVDVDEMLTTWRYRHAQMVLRMLGRKIGTGGSSGYDYLHSTAVRHHIFLDFHNISTLLIPRHALPPLPAQLKQELGFQFTANRKKG